MENLYTMRVCDTSYGTFRFWFALGFRSHSLRRGGATARAIRGYTMVQIMLEGRWSCESSCRLYLKTAEAKVVCIRRDLDSQTMALCRSIGSSWATVARDCVYSDELRVCGTSAFTRRAGATANLGSQLL